MGRGATAEKPPPAARRLGPRRAQTRALGKAGGRANARGEAADQRQPKHERTARTPHTAREERQQRSLLLLLARPRHASRQSLQFASAAALASRVRHLHTLLRSPPSPRANSGQKRDQHLRSSLPSSHPRLAALSAPSAHLSTSSAPSASSATSASNSDRYARLLHELLTINIDRRIRLGIETTRALLAAAGPAYDLPAACASGRGPLIVHVAAATARAARPPRLRPRCSCTACASASTPARTSPASASACR